MKYSNNNIMEDPASLIGTLLEKTEHYIKSGAELYKLKAIDKSADLVSTLTARLALIVFLILVFLMLSVGVALLIGEILGKTYYGFFIVSGFYLLVGIVLYYFRNTLLKTPLRNSIVTQALN